MEKFLFTKLLCYTCDKKLYNLYDAFARSDKYYDCETCFDKNNRIENGISDKIKSLCRVYKEKMEIQKDLENVVEKKEVKPTVISSCVCMDCEKNIEKIEDARILPDLKFICTECWEAIPDEEEFKEFIEGLVENYNLSTKIKLLSRPLIAQLIETSVCQ